MKTYVSKHCLHAFSDEEELDNRPCNKQDAPDALLDIELVLHDVWLASAAFSHYSALLLRACLRLAGLRLSCLRSEGCP